MKEKQQYSMGIMEFCLTFTLPNKKRRNFFRLKFTDYFASLNRLVTSSQLMTFHQLSMYSGRLF